MAVDREFVYILRAPRLVGRIHDGSDAPECSSINFTPEMKKALLKSREKQTIGTPLGSPIHHNMMGNVNMIENINDWKKAPLWDKKSIDKATKGWFKYLG